MIPSSSKYIYRYVPLKKLVFTKCMMLILENRLGLINSSVFFFFYIMEKIYHALNDVGFFFLNRYIQLNIFEEIHIASWAVG